MLNSRLQAQVRARVERHLTQTCQIERKTFATDEYGDRSLASTLVIPSACFLTKVSRSSAQETAGADLGRVYYNLHLPYDTDIRDGDEVVIIDAVTAAEERYTVDQAIRSQGVNVMRQAVLIKAGS